MKNNSNGGKALGGVGAKSPLPADAEYRKELQQEAALVDPTGERNIGNNENNETPSNVSSAEPIPNSNTDNSNDVEKDIYNPATWHMFNDL